MFGFQSRAFQWPFLAHLVTSGWEYVVPKKTGFFNFSLSHSPIFIFSKWATGHYGRPENILRNDHITLFSNTLPKSDISGTYSERLVSTAHRLRKKSLFLLQTSSSFLKFLKAPIFRKKY